MDFDTAGMQLGVCNCEWRVAGSMGAIGPIFQNLILGQAESDRVLSKTTAGHHRGM